MNNDRLFYNEMDLVEPSDLASFIRNVPTHTDRYQVQRRLWALNGMVWSKWVILADSRRGFTSRCPKRSQ
ncbi:MAG: hypothetical protein ABI645_00630 [Pseudomonadota bacterium]